MGISVKVDETLVEQAEKLSGEKDREKLVDQALRE